MTLTGGHLLALRLQAAPEGPDALIPFARTTFARDHRLSRPHVVNLLREAEASGWLRREAEGLRVAPPSSRRSSDGWPSISPWRPWPSMGACWRLASQACWPSTRR
jgi:hypothetical protein